jgi:hypothetical protein
MGTHDEDRVIAPDAGNGALDAPPEQIQDAWSRLQHVEGQVAALRADFNQLAAQLKRWLDADHDLDLAVARRFIQIEQAVKTLQESTSASRN